MSFLLSNLTEAAFEIDLNTWQLLKLLPREIYIFSNVRQQIIANSYCLKNIHVNFWRSYYLHFYTLSEQTPIIEIIN